MNGYVKGNPEREKALRKRQRMIGEVKKLKEEGLNCAEIAEKLKMSESTVRACVSTIDQAKTNK